MVVVVVVVVVVLMGWVVKEVAVVGLTGWVVREGGGEATLEVVVVVSVVRGVTVGVGEAVLWARGAGQVAGVMTVGRGVVEGGKEEMPELVVMGREGVELSLVHFLTFFSFVIGCRGGGGLGREAGQGGLRCRTFVMAAADDEKKDVQDL